MDDSQFDQMIDVNKLQPGMFIHLDLGWMSHPFAWNSFKIESWSQVSTLRSLGLKLVRWSPSRSDAHALPLAKAAADSAAPAEPSLGAVPQQRSSRARGGVEPKVLRHQQAMKAYAQLIECLPEQAQQARTRASALVGSLLDEMRSATDLQLCLIEGSTAGRELTHALNVCIVSLMLGLNLELAPEELVDLGLGALLHDVGKLVTAAGSPQHDGRGHYEEHVRQGLVLAQRMELPQQVQQIIAQHHEHADGSGFPTGAGIDEMSVGARIVAMVNRFDGLCNPPKAAHALSPHEAISLMFVQDRQRFGLNMLNAFVRMVGVYPPGSVVQLTDDRAALVVSANASKALKPQVLAYAADGVEQRPERIDLSRQASLGIWRGLKPQPHEAAYRATRKRMNYFFEPGAQGGQALMA